jgi:hypothetical protein
MAVSLKENNWFFCYGSNSTPTKIDLPGSSSGNLSFSWTQWLYFFRVLISRFEGIHWKSLTYLRTSSELDVTQCEWHLCNTYHNSLHTTRYFITIQWYNLIIFYGEVYKCVKRSWAIESRFLGNYTLQCSCQNIKTHCHCVYLRKINTCKKGISVYMMDQGDHMCFLKKNCPKCNPCHFF